jgi:hypothetical protein
MRLFPTASQLQRVLPNVQDLSICLVGLRLAVMSGSNLLLGLQFLNPSLPKAGGRCVQREERSLAGLPGGDAETARESSFVLREREPRLRTPCRSNRCSLCALIRWMSSSSWNFELMSSVPARVCGLHDRQRWGELSCGIDGGRAVCANITGSPRVLGEGSGRDVGGMTQL